MSSVRLLARNFVILFSGNVAGQLIYFAATLYLARVLGPGVFGIWSFAQAWQLYLLRFGEFGFEVTAIREVARRPEDTASWIGRVVCLRLLFSFFLIAGTVFVVTGNLVPHGSGNAVVLFSLAVVPVSFALEWVYEARQNVVTTGVARIAKGVLFGLGVVWLVRGSADFTNSVLSYLLSVTIPVGAVFVIAVRSFGFDLVSFSWARARELIRNASEVGIANILSHYSLFIGTMIVGYVLTEIDLGLFSAAHRVVVLPWAYVIVSFQRVLLPTLARWYVESRSQFESFVDKFFRFTVIVSFGIGLAGTFFGPTLMSLLYSSAYAGATEVFVVLLWALAFAGMRFIFEIALVASDNQRQYLKGMVLLAALYTIATPLLSSKYGIVGAAWAGVAAEFGYFLYLAITFPHMQVTTLVRLIWKPVIACLLAVVTGALLGSAHFAVQGIMSLCVFLGFLVFFKAISSEDAQTLLQLAGARQAINRSGSNHSRSGE